MAINENEEMFAFRGFNIPVRLLAMTGGGTDTFDLISQSHIDQLQQYIGIRPGAKILEIGCGIGRDAIPLAELISPEGTYKGTDVIGESVAWCKANITAKFPNFEFFHHDIKDTLHNPEGTLEASGIHLPYGDGEVDLVILQSVFTHMFVDEIRHYLSEFRRILTPEGRVWASVFIVNDDVLAAIANNAKTLHALSFKHSYGRGCFINSEVEPRGAVALDLAAVFRLLDGSGLVMSRPILWGSWSGVRNNPESGQDILILKRT
jgi:ubiquinone/menaquinone biosynthesis C-methylase UbiE